ncbi:MAG TPA: protein DpdG [Verrucomicrobiae bacterium]|jgi:hypothetical protein|nr:protein DpdG [Verrucomicrobiae bacterium]
MKIYTTVEPVPSRMLAVARLLATTDSLAKEEILRRLQPLSTATSDQSGQAEKTLDAAVECGLVVKREVGYCLGQSVTKEERNPEELEERLPVILARLVLVPQINGEENLFASALAWFLTQPLLAMPQDHGGLKNRMEQNGLTLDAFGLRADTRWDMIVYWARYLGLGRQMAEEKARGLIPDPTAYVFRHLKELLTTKNKITAEMFKQTLGALCPVLDGGAVFTRMDALVNPERPKHQLSEALSFALDRLQRRKVLRYWCPDDQRDFLLTDNGEKIAFIQRL